MATENLLAEFKKNRSKFQGSLDSEESIKYYYKQYFDSFGIGYQEYCLPNKETLYNLLSTNEKYVVQRQGEMAYYLNQAFSTAGSEFKVFDTENTDVIVPYKEGIQIINDLNSEKARWNDHIVSDALEKAKQYTVSLYSYQLNKLEKLGALYKILDDKATVLQPQFYDDYIGVIDEDKNYGYLEVSI
jgi:CRISPR-associated endonuclease/helicase Cas3